MLTLSETGTQKPVLSLTAGETKELTPGYVGEQAAKLHLALKDQSPGVNQLSSALTLNSAEQYKRLLADQNEIQRVEVRNDILGEMLSQDPKSIDQNTISVIQNLSNSELESEDLQNIIERNYARLYTNTAASNLGNDILEDAKATDPEVTYELLDRTERVVFKQNFIATKAAEVQKEIDGMSWGDTVWNFTERLVPFLEWYQKQNAVGADSEMVSSFLPGNNLEEQFAYLWSISDPSVFSEKLEVAVRDLKSRNPYVAQSWLQGLVSYGSSDSFMDNLFGVADMSTVLPLGTLSKALKGVAKAGVKTPLKLWKHTKELGQNDVSAIGKIAEEISDGTFKAPDINNYKALEDSTPSIHQPDSLLVGSQNVPQAAYLRMKEALMNNAELAKKFLTDVNLVDRADPQELLQYKDVLLRQYVKDNPSIQKNVIDVRIADDADVGNVYTAEVIIGRRDGTLFESAQQAETYFRRFIKGTDDFVVRQVGAGFEIAVKKTVDESKFLSDLTLPTMSQTPDSLANRFGGWWRSPNYIVSRNAELARSTVVTSTERLRGIYEELAQPFSRLSKDEVKELDDLLSVNQHSKEFKNYGEFEQAFYLRFKKNPTVDQAETWASYRQMMDLDLMVRDLDWYKQKAIQGREKIKLGDIEFEGKVLDDLPFGSTTPFTYTVYEKGKFGSRKVSTYANEAERTKVRELLKDGYKAVQVADQALDIGDKKYVGFVLVKNPVRNRVGVQNVGRRAGGHKVDTYVGYVKQGEFADGPDVSFYKRDKTLFGFRTEQEGREYVKLLEQARQMALRKDPGTMKFVRDVLGMDTKRWSAAVADGTIDLSKEFVFTPKGARTIDTGAYKNLPNVRAEISEFNLDAKLLGKYGGERDMSSIDVITSESDIAFEVRGAEYLSPIETLRVSSGSVISARLMHDYTLATHRNFLKEFGDILEGTREELLSSGISVLTDPKFVSGANPERVRLAKNVSRAYKNLLNQGTYIDNLIDIQKDKIVTSVMRKFGPRGANFVSDRILPLVKDPGVYLRSFAFHTKMGLFNVNQFFVQSQSMTNIVAIGGLNGLKSGSAYPLFRAALYNGDSKIVRTIANTAERVGLMKADEFEESLRLYKKSGFDQIGQDVAYLDDARGPEIRQGSVSKILSYGTRPFNAGERMVRIAAFNTAYLEQKALLKGAKIDRRVEAKILQRAKDLTANMTRESNAEWQKGYAAIATQFMGYQARIMEQFLGKKLTAAEKVRLFTGYSAMYGMPVAAGATMGVLPVREILLQGLSDYEIDIEGTLAEPLIDGFASAFYEFIAGEELNFASRYGPGGLPTLYDFLREDSSWMDVFLGASGSIALDTVSPIFKRMASEFADFEGGAYNLQPMDFMSTLRNISSVDNAVKLYQVHNIGVWMSKNGNQLTEMDLPHGIIAALTGLTPEKIADAYRKVDSLKEWKEEKKIFMNETVKAYRQIIKMENSATREKMTRELKAKAIAYGLTANELSTAWKRAFNEEMFVDSVIDSYSEGAQKRK